MSTKQIHICRLIDICADDLTAPGAGNCGNRSMPLRMFQLAEDIGAVYGREFTGLSDVVPYYERQVSADCFQSWDIEQTPDRAARLVRTIVWRTGLLVAMLAADSEVLPMKGIDSLLRLVCCVVPLEATPKQETMERLITLAEAPHSQSPEILARRILRQLSGGTETLRDASPASSYGHPIDSGLVKMLDTPAINGIFRALVDFNADTAMGQMLASSIPVAPGNFPELNRIVDDCAAKLNIQRPYVVVTNQIPGINAMTFGSDEEPYIAITSLMVKIMTEPGMRFVIGHECGHIAMGHVVYHTAASALGQFSQMLPLVGPLVSRSISYPLNAWSRRSEITADRAGFLCCGNLEQSKRTLLQIESAFAPADTLDLDSYMENSRQFLEKGLLRKLGEYGANHPLTPKRIQALDLFAQSELYYRATGQKAPEGAVSASDLARQTEAIIKVL